MAIDKTQEYLTKVRELEGLKNAILSGISVEKKRGVATFTLITDKAYALAEEGRARELSAQFLPDGFTAEVHIVKRVPDREILKKTIYKYLNTSFPAAAAFMREEDIEIELLSSGAHFFFRIASGEQTLFSSGKILDAVSAHLKTLFCGAFYGDVKLVEKEIDESVLDELPETEEEYVPEIRTFPIFEFSKLDGVDEIPKRAVYIADATMPEGPFHLCGTLVYVEERKYVKHNEKTNEDVEKSRFSLTLSDGTGNLRITYFPKKATVDKVRELKAGDNVVLSGENEEYNGGTSFKASKLNFGRPPENFEPVKRKSKPVPKFYHTVFPEEYVDYTQAGLFDNLGLPEDLKKNVFVVFDLETTGLVHQPSMGKMDKIIEIGAVKIVNGEMKEKFSSFVACKDKLSPEIIKLTGIEDADLVGAPSVEEVIADFYKFTDGAYLVGHNVQFDLDFVKYYGNENGYAFEHKPFDTLALSQERFRAGEIPNYKLNTVADYYGFTFNHHRAFDDACVTAKIFIELMKARGKLPL